MKKLSQGLSEKFVVTTFGFALLLLCGVGTACYLSIQELKKDKQWVIHTYEVIQTLDEINTGLIVTESARRGFIITNKDMYIDTYEVEKSKIYKALKNAYFLTKDNPNQQLNLDLLEPLVNQRLIGLEESIQQFKNNPKDMALQVTVTDRNREIRQQIKIIIDVIKNQEKTLLEQRIVKTNKSAHKIVIFVIVGTFLGILILAFVYYLLTKQIRINKRLSEEALILEKQVAQSRLVNFLENTSDAFVAIDKNWNYTYINNKAGQLFNRIPEDLIGKNIWQEFPEGIGQKFYHAYQKAMREQEFIYIEEYYPPWQRWYENRIYPSEEGLWIFFQDISFRKIAETTLREQEERWQLAIDGSNDGIWDHDLKTNLHFLSPRCLQILGYEENEIDNFDEWVNLVHPEDRLKLMEAFDAHVNREILHYSCEYRMIAKDGTYKWVLARGKALWDEQKIPIRMVGSLTDITSRKQAEEELQQAKETLEIKVKERTAELSLLNEELENSNRELEHFAYIASHDLQEPLRAITGYTQLLNEEYSSYFDKSAQEYMDYIINGAARMRQLIKDLLAYSRVGNRKLQLTYVDCNAVIQEVIKNLQIAIAENHATITYEQLPTITADETRILQLFQNIISNAIKFRRDDAPKIHIRVTRKEKKLESEKNINILNPKSSSYWLFSLEDNGIGIKPQYLERIFEIFRRLHTSREFPGTGIGLAICKKIAELHGGNIWAESEFGKGTIFYITLDIV
jgi:PAS domain S-box-containing protein